MNSTESARATQCTRTGSHILPSGDVDNYVKEILPSYTSIKPPEGVVLILEVDGNIAGMGALKTLDEKVGEIKRMYVCPEFRGKGYGRKMLKDLEDKVMSYDFSILRLDTGGNNVPARRLYESAGYMLRDRYEDSESSEEMGELLNIIFMEKQLK